MLKVLLTVDTEAHAISKDWQRDHLARDIQRDIYGRIGERSVGLDYQLEALERFGLKAVFMVESLFSAVPEIGPEPLREIVGKIHKGGHEVQLHLHPEWVPFCPELKVEYRSELLRDYSLEEQTRMIAFASEKLQACGAEKPIAFRAGGFAADANTIAAMQRADIRFDSSFNIWYAGGKCRLAEPESYGRATPIGSGDVLEIPIAAMEDYPGHLRHAQLCACGGNEMVHALEQAEADGWEIFTIVSHSFEMITRRRGSKPPFIRESVVKRFEKICGFLGRAVAVKGRPWDMVERVVEQVAHRVERRVR